MMLQIEQGGFEWNFTRELMFCTLIVQIIQQELTNLSSAFYRNCNLMTQQCGVSSSFIRHVAPQQKELLSPQNH